MQVVGINNNNSKVNFGLVLKTCYRSNGLKSAEMLDTAQEIGFYKNLRDKLTSNSDKFTKTTSGLKSKDLSISYDRKFPESNTILVMDKTGQYLITDITKYGIPKGEEYRKMRNSFDNLLNSL